MSLSLLIIHRGGDTAASSLHAIQLFVLRATCVLACLSQILYCLEEGKAAKKARAPTVTTADGDALHDPDQSLDERNGLLDDNQNNNNGLPLGFLSPSVREYLELGKSIPGRPGTDYPVLSVVPYTDFYCEDQPYPGFFADMETRCQAWHYCDIDGRQTSFLCPNGTQFSQAVFICDWWFNVKCDLSPKLYAINERLYRKQPKENPIKPHREITKELVDSIFLRKR